MIDISGKYDSTSGGEHKIKSSENKEQFKRNGF